MQSEDISKYTFSSLPIRIRGMVYLKTAEMTTEM